jgi:cation diffusion facilitator family transporter
MLWRAMVYSIVVGFFLAGVKILAFGLTGSAAILSDAAESTVHMVAILFAAYSLRLTYKPADRTHLYGHAKIGFFSAGVEGCMILVAAVLIYVEALHKFFHPEPILHWTTGLVLTAGAAVANGLLGLYLFRLGSRAKSLILRANGLHLLADCRTSAAVVISLILSVWLRSNLIDPIAGALVATSIAITGVVLVRSGFSGLMDAANPVIERQIAEILDSETALRSVTYHNVRHRNLGDSYWIDLHLVFPPGILLSDAHRTATEIERQLSTQIGPDTKVTTHLESALDHDILHDKGD